MGCRQPGNNRNFCRLLPDFALQLSFIDNGSRASNVKLPSPHHRFLIALHSPDGVAETGLLGCAPEKKAAKLDYSIEHKPFSGPVLGQELQDCAHFLQFPEQSTRISLHFRLYGGESGIRSSVFCHNYFVFNEMQ